MVTTIPQVPNYVKEELIDESTLLPTKQWASFFEDIDFRLSQLETTNGLIEGSQNLYATEERTFDWVAQFLLPGTGINLSVNDPANTITISATLTAQYRADTRFNILSTAPSVNGDTAFATDTRQTFVGLNGSWHVQSPPVVEDNNPNPSIGTENYINVTGYTEYSIVEKRIIDCDAFGLVVRDTIKDGAEGMLKNDDTRHVPQYYNGSAWQDFVVGLPLVVNEDGQIQYNPTESPELNIAIDSGNSTQKATNGIPVVQSFVGHIGAASPYLYVGGA